MLKKRILIVVAALATYSFGAAPAAKTPAKKAVVVTAKTFKGSYVPGEVSEEIKQKCTQTISWRADDAAWLQDQFALAPAYSMISDSKRAAVRNIKEIFGAGVDAQFGCVFEDTKEQVYVSATFGQTETTVVVSGKAKEARAGLMPFFETMVTKKENNAVLYNFLKGVGVAGVAAAVKVFGIDPLMQRRADQDEARIAVLKKDEKRRQRALSVLAVRSYNPIDTKEWFPAGTDKLPELIKDISCPQLLDGFHEELRKAFSVWELWGGRREAEDAVDVCQKGDWLAFAVYDGHGGDQTSLALAGMKKCGKGSTDVEKAVLERDSAAESTRLLPQLVDVVIASGVEKAAIAKLYQDVDEKLVAVAGASGATAVVLLVNKKTQLAYFINLGDSRAVAVDDAGKAVHATKDHSPECEKDCVDAMHNVSCPKHAASWMPCSKLEGCNDGHVSHCEVKRICDAGGFVLDGVVDMRLRVARSFGDFSYKFGAAGSRAYHVGIEPDIVSFNLTDVSRIVLACDGVWDVIGNVAGKQKYGWVQEIDVEAVGSILKRAFEGTFNPAEYLCKSAFKAGSDDNISAVVVHADALRVLFDPVVAVADDASGFDVESDGSARAASGRGSSRRRESLDVVLRSVVFDDHRCAIYSKGCEPQDGLDCGFHASCNADSIQMIIEGKPVGQHLQLIAGAPLKTKQEIQDRRDASGLRAEHSCLEETGVVSFITETLGNGDLHASTAFPAEETVTTFLCLPEFTQDKQTVENATKLLVRITCREDIQTIRDLMARTTRKSGRDVVPDFESSASCRLASGKTISMQELQILRTYLSYIKDIFRGTNMLGQAVAALKAGKTVIMPWLSHSLDSSRVREGASLRGVSTGGIGHWTCKVFIPEHTSTQLSKINVVDVDSLGSGGLGVYQSIRGFIDYCFKNDGNTKAHAITLIKIFGRDRCDEIITHFGISDGDIA